jgi:hypothetical protein
MGVTVRPEGLKLHTVLAWQRLPWSRIDHFEWQQWSWPQAEWLWAITPDGRRVLIPTVQRAATDGKVTAFFTSERLRTRDGRIVDALEALTAALATARQSARRVGPVA